MGIQYNPRTIVDGLVLALDAGNIKSYNVGISSTTWTDIIGRGNTGTLTNGPTYSNQNGGSIVFNGENNYVENLSPNLGISGDTSVTLSCWFYNSVNSSDNQALLVYGNGSTGGDSISILLRNLSFYASFNGGLDAVIADNVYALNTWNNVVVTKTPGAINTTTKLYLNGVEQTITSASSSTPSLSSRVVRVARWTADASPFYLQGGVSAALIYNRALSAAEVLQNYNSLKNRFVTAPVLIPSEYRISRSLRFNSADSAYFNRTPSVAGNRKTWTFACWIKNAFTPSAYPRIFSAGTTTANTIEITLLASADSSQLRVLGDTASTRKLYWTTVNTFRDPGSWFHLVVALDTTQAVAANRLGVYINGTRITTSGISGVLPSQNDEFEINNTSTHYVGRSGPYSEYMNGYLADIHFIDGQALTPSSFTETNSNTGQLIPKFYSGTYGVNGFRLNFSNNSAATAATLGADSGADSGGGISAATGALPIYNTTDNYGTTKGTGTRTDANASSLVLAIPMDGANNGTTFTDESATIKGSGSAKAITVVGNTKTLTAQSKFYGSSGFFDGNGDLLTIADTSDLDQVGDFTHEGWYYRTGSGVGSLDILFYKNVTNYLYVAVDKTTNKFVVNQHNIANLLFGTTVTVANTWYHVAIARQSGTVRLFVNGVLEGSLSNSTNTTGSAASYIGGNHTGAHYTNGYLQDLRIYKGVAKYTSNFTPPLGPNNWTPNNLSVNAGGQVSISAASGALPVYNTTDAYGAVKGTGTRTDSNASSLVLAIPMNGANNGTTFTDESATIKGSGSAKAITRNGDTKTSTTQSKYYGSSGFFDGTGDYLSCASSADFAFGTGDYTVEAWIYKTSSSRLTLSSVSGGSGLAVNINTSGNIEICRALTAIDFTFTANIQNNIWTHIAVTRTGTSLRAYKDGVLLGTQTSSTNYGQGTFYVGIDGDAISFPYVGYIQDLRVYKGVAKYTSNFTPPSATQNTTVAAGCDSLTDTPTSYGTDLGNGDEVRGNYATLNPTNTGASNISFSNGNLDYTSGGTGRGVSTISMVPGSGKFYCEFTCTSTALFNHPGIYADSISVTTDANRIVYRQDGNVYTDGALTQTITSFTNGNIIGMAFNADTRQLTYYKNGSLVGGPYQASTPPNGGGYYFHILSGSNSGCSGTFNFGQRPFVYQAPTGFKCLCDTNLPTPTIAKPNTVMDVKLWAGDGSSSRSLTDLNFSPDFLWVKSRNQAYNHTLFDVTRGAGSQKALYSNTNESEASGNSNTTFGYLSSFDSNGFSVVKGSSGTNSYTNHLNDSYVAWAWDAGSSTVTNTAGTITSQVRANASAGFSVVTFTTPGSGAFTVGHGLGVAPSFIITKARNFAYGWSSYHISIGLNAYIELNTTSAQISSTGVYGTHTSTVASYGSIYAGGLNEVTYNFAPVTGYSSFGSYTGNGSADGPFVYTGFRPRWIITKPTSIAGSWLIHDTSRNPYNISVLELQANDQTAEYSTAGVGAGDRFDILSNGFKNRSANAGANQNAATYIYAAFAENPFQYSRAR